MKKLLFFVLLLLLTCEFLSAQYSPGWKRGLQSHGYTAAIKPTPDKGFISTFNSWGGYSGGICGSCDRTATGYNSILIVKMDSIGKIEWSHCLTGKNNTFASDLLVSNDGTIILTGANSSDNGFFTDIPSKSFWNIFLVKFSATGDVLWKKNIDNLHNEVPAKILASQEGGFLVGASSDNPINYPGTSYITGTGEFYLLKFDDNGNIQWNKRYGGSAQDQLNSVQQDLQGNYTAIGWTRSNNGMVTGNPTQNSNTWMMQVDQSGNLVKQKVLDLSVKTTANDLLIDPLGSFVLAGTQEKGSIVITTDVWALKLSQDWNTTIWEKVWSPSNNAYGNKLVYTKEGRYLLAATTNANIKNLITNYQPNRDWWLMELDSASGNVNWDRSYGGHSNYYNISVEPVGNSDRLILFGSANGNPGATDFWGDIYYWHNGITDMNNFAVAGYQLLYKDGTPPPVLPTIVKDTVSFNKTQCGPPYLHSDGQYYYRDTSFITLRQDGAVYKVYEKLDLKFAPPLIHKIIDTTVCYAAVVNNVVFTTNGTTNIYFKSQADCDSLRLQYNVHVLPDIKYEYRDSSICRGTMFIDTVLTEGDKAVIIKTVKNYLQCDSLRITYNVGIRDSYDTASVKDTTVCYGGLFRGVNLYNDTIVVDTVSTSLNCGNVPLQYFLRIDVRPKLVINLGRDTSICTGRSIILSPQTSEPNLYYQWSTGSLDPSISVNTIGTYWVRAMNAYGCKTEDTIVISLKTDPPVMAATGDTVICRGGTATLKVAGGKSYSWSPGIGLDCDTCSTVIAKPSITTTYIVLINGNCRQAVDTITVAIDQPFVDATSHRKIFVGDTVHLQAFGNGVSYSWQPATGLSCTNCHNPIAKPLKTTLYTVTMTTAAGCIATDTVSIEVSDENGIILKSILTPDGDGRDDVVKPPSPFLNQFKMEVYDSNGQPIFSTNDPSRGWDGSIGRYNGTKVMTGIYYYVLQYVATNGRAIRTSGRILVIR